MRKLGILFVSLFTIGGFYSSALAECKLQVGDCTNDNEVLQPSGQRGCYVCGEGTCDNGDTVTVIGTATVRGGGGGTYTDRIYECKAGGAFYDDHWSVRDVPECTETKYTRMKGKANVKKKAINPNIGTTSSNDADSYIIIAQRVCWAYVCSDDYTEINGECVDNDIINAQQQCTSTGGTWANNACSCPSAKRLKLKANGAGCECTSTDYSFNAATMQCEKTQAARDRDNQRERDRQNQNKKTACENSGGTWTGSSCTCDAAKNLKAEGGVCVCTDSVNYKPAPDGKSCVLTDRATLQRECEAGASTGAYWDAVQGCLCTNPQHIWRAGKCSLNPLIENCNLIPGANWIGGKCVCVAAGKELNKEGTACVDSAETVAANLSASLQRSRNEISGASSKINAIKESFKKTVWKDEDGKFNTTRLASDSIAAVVLGTAGGLITSNVIKKNQVKNGFEDINCTVGGQKVAGWGDEFRVGIQ